MQQKLTLTMRQLAILLVQFMIFSYCVGFKEFTNKCDLTFGYEWEQGRMFVSKSILSKSPDSIFSAIKNRQFKLQPVTKGEDKKAPKPVSKVPEQCYDRVYAHNKLILDGEKYSFVTENGGFLEVVTKALTIGSVCKCEKDVKDKFKEIKESPKVINDPTPCLLPVGEAVFQINDYYVATTSFSSSGQHTTFPVLLSKLCYFFPGNLEKINSYSDAALMTDITKGILCLVSNKEDNSYNFRISFEKILELYKSDSEADVGQKLLVEDYLKTNNIIPKALKGEDYGLFMLDSKPLILVEDRTKKLFDAFDNCAQAITNFKKVMKDINDIDLSGCNSVAI